MGGIRRRCGESRILFVVFNPPAGEGILIIVVACLIAVVSVTVIVMGCCFMKRSRTETRKPTVAISRPQRLETNTCRYTDIRDEHSPSGSHHGLVSRTADPGYDRLYTGQDRLMKFADRERDTTQIYSHLARQEADVDWTDENIYDTTFRQLGGTRTDTSYDKVIIQKK